MRKEAFESLMRGLQEVRDWADGKLEAYEVPHPTARLLRLRPIREGKGKA